MREKDIVKAVEEHVKRQNNDWRFIAGREVLDKEGFLKKLKRDKNFRSTIVKMVVELSIDILTRKAAE